jgi:long-chain acyl-CoA synthetase
MITYGQRTITYAEMDERSSRVARALGAEGVAAQDRVAFLDKNGPEYFEVLFGGGKINAVNVAVNWRLAPAEMKYTIDDAEAKVLFVGPDFFPHLAELEGTLRTVKKIVALGEHPRHEGYAGWVGRQLPEDTGLTSAPDDVAMQLYTSGTTGLPKGAMLTNANLGTILPHVAAPWSLDETSVNVVAMPLFHIGGSGWALCGMWHGCHSILFREFVPQEILAALVRHRVTNALFVPAMLQILSALPGAAEGEYGALRSIIYGASPITDEVLVRAMKTFRCSFIQVNGLTETTGAITELGFADTIWMAAGFLRSAGKPYPGSRCGSSTRNGDCAAGEVGELWTRSVQNMKATGTSPRRWRASSRRTAGSRPATRASRMGKGTSSHDRVKDMKIVGRRECLSRGDERAVGPSRYRGRGGHRGADKGRDRQGYQRRFIDYARQRLARYKCPTSVDFLDALPRNPSGKLLKRQLREPY